MDLRSEITSIANQPIPHRILVDLLKDYKRPNDKITSLKTKGLITPIKKGLYIAGSSIGTSRPESALIANHILGPSYISMESALSHYGMIPEKVYAVTSMCTKESRKFNTSIGLYTYTYLPLPYFAYGLHTVIFSQNQSALIAIAEKALCDKIVTTSGITFRSQKAAHDYVIGNLRMEERDLSSFNTKLMESWLDNAPKRGSLEMLINMIKKL